MRRKRHRPSSGSLRLTVLACRRPAVVAFLRRHIPQAVRICGCPLRDLAVIIATDALIRRLHRKFLGGPSLTDVVTFLLEEDDKKRPVSAEIYLCLSVARRQARLRRIPVRHELLLYAIHGILHLSGFDDVTPRKYGVMHKEEDRVLRQLGVGAVFSRPELGAGHRKRVTRSGRR